MRAWKNCKRDAVKAIHDANPQHEHDLTGDEQTLLERANGKILVFTLGGPLLFGVAKAISRKYAVLSTHEILIIDFTEVPILGVSSSLALENIIQEDLKQQRPVFIVGAVGDVEERLQKLGVMEQLPPGHVRRDPPKGPTSGLPHCSRRNRRAR